MLRFKEDVIDNIPFLPIIKLSINKEVTKRWQIIVNYLKRQIS